MELLRTKKPVERFLMMASLIQDQFEMMRAGIQFKNPSISKKELNNCLRNKILKIYSLKH